MDLLTSEYVTLWEIARQAYDDGREGIPSNIAEATTLGHVIALLLPISVQSKHI